MRPFSVLLLSIVILFACKQSSDMTENTPQTTPEIFVSMFKTPCYGKCPTYSMSIYNNGSIEYNGKKFVEKEGNYTGMLSSDQINQIKEKVNEINFFELNSKYDSNVTDFPSCVIEVKIDDRTKKITDRVGAPKELKELETLIEELVFGSELKKVEE